MTIDTLGLYPAGPKAKGEFHRPIFATHFAGIFLSILTVLDTTS